LIVGRSPEEFLACYSRLETMDLVSLSARLQVAYTDYLEEIKHETMYFPAERSFRTIEAPMTSKLMVKMKWVFRYFRHGSCKKVRRNFNSSREGGQYSPHS